MSLWKIIAKNEIRVMTNRVRKNRTLFFITIYSIFFFWALYLGPILLDMILPEIVKNFTDYYKSYIVLLMDYAFILIFMVYIIYPLFQLYKNSEIINKDMLFAAPIKPGDIFLGEFMAQIPFYSLFILGLGPLGTGLLRQVNPEMTSFHYAIFYGCAFMATIFGLLIGTIISNWIELKMGKSKKNKDLGKAYILVSSIFIIIIYYLIRFTFEIIYNNPEFKYLLFFFPSFWYSSISIYTIEPSLTESYLPNIGIISVLAVVIPLIIIYISYKKASFFYNLESQIEFNAVITKEEKMGYLIIRKITPNKIQGLIITQFKVFLRKKENIIKLVYSIALIAILGIIIRISLTQEITFSENEFLSNLIMGLYQKDYLIITILSWMGGLIFGIFIGSHVIFNSKELIHLYKRSPRGIRSLVTSFFLTMLYIIILMDIPLTVLFSILFGIDVMTSLVFSTGFIIYSIIILSQSIGLQSCRPLFDERSKDVFFNMYLLFFFQIISILITFFITFPNFSITMDISISFSYIFFINIIISAAVACIILFLGIRKLDSIE